MSLSPVDSPPAKPQTSGRPRFPEVDYLRGFVMVVMAIDHCHYFLTSPSLSPTNVGNTTAGQFFTRWITHFCAPIFVFLAGTGTFLRGTRGSTKGSTARFLITRGIWLVFLELTVVRWDWTFTTDVGFSSAQVLWAIGWSMIFLALLIYLPSWLLAALATVLISCHNAFDWIDPNSLGSLRPLWLLLHGQGRIDISPSISFYVYYPIVPWVGVMIAGYLFGNLLILQDRFRRKWLIITGLAVIGLFVGLRALNLYGDPHPWVAQSNLLDRFMSFLNCEKYPPSLLFLSMTLGPGILLLAVPAERWGRVGRICGVFGRAPLLYYLLHIAIIHALALAFAYLRFGDASFLSNNEWLIAPEHYPPDWGYNLWVVYAVWISVVIGLYPICHWFGRLKQKKKHWWWLSYL